MQDQKTFGERLKHAWNAFQNRDPTSENWYDIGQSSSRRPDKLNVRGTTERSIVNSIYNRIAVDVSENEVRHVRKDENDRFVEEIKSGLNYCLSEEANIDQTGKALMQDIVMSMFDEGCVAVVPIDTTIDPRISGSYEVNSLRTGKILDWFPQHVRVEVYNEKTGNKENLILPKKSIAIIENPFYPIMNAPNSILKRLIRKLNLLDSVDEQSSSGKLDLIIQLPYVIKTEARKKQATERRKDIEMQLTGSKYGIAYTDGTERITQLNRPTENNLMAQVQYLTTMLYSQLGLTEAIFNGDADEKTMLNYFNRTMIPILSAILDELKRKFLTKTARTQGQSIMVFKDPFKLLTATSLANIADKFTRNEILSSNEIRANIGFKPSNDPNADALKNKNINASRNGPEVPIDSDAIINQNGITSDQAMSIFEELLDSLEGDIDSIVGGEEENVSGND